MVMVQYYPSDQTSSHKKKTQLLCKNCQKSYSPSALALSNENAEYGYSCFYKPRLKLRFR